MLRVAHAAWADAQAGGQLTTEWSEGTFEGAGREKKKECPNQMDRCPVP